MAQALADLKAAVSQCDSLIANAHQVDDKGKSILPVIDREQITVAAFLNTFIAWERFLEETIADLMIGGTTISGQAPVRYVVPLNLKDANAMIIGVRPYFDFANHDNVRKITGMYFQNSYPFEPHLSSIFSDLADLKTLRNASAHISSSTQTALESLAGRIFGQRRSGITLYQLLTAVDPRSTANDTVFLTYKNKLMVTAELIAQG